MCDDRQILTKYKLIGNATYSCNHCFILMSKMKKTNYQDTKHIGVLYNLIQGCQWKDLVGMLKGKFRILLSRVDIPLHHMPNLDMFAQHVHC